MTNALPLTVEEPILDFLVFDSGFRLPILSPRDPKQSISATGAISIAQSTSFLEREGAVLFRGFCVADISEFQEFARGLGGPLLSYEFGSTPRKLLLSGVYSSTEYPAHQAIPLHNEQSYSLEWPMKIWFHCVLPARSGGETPIGDSREIYHRVDAAIRRRFTERRLMYVRNFGNGLDVAWEQAFNTADRGNVEQFCKAHGIASEWKRDGELRTRQICQATARHPRTSQLVWFNQAHLFHVSALGAEVRGALLEAVGEADLPRNVYYGDGSPIEDSILEEIRGVLTQAKTSFAWQAGDVLMLDNMLVAHAREPYEGPRTVVVAMAESSERRSVASVGA